MAAPHVHPADKFDESRRAWIAEHQGWSTIQRRRAERLGRRVRARQRAVATAVPDPHDDVSIPPLLLRVAKSPAAQLELTVVIGAVIVAPLGWLTGKVLAHAVVGLIPRTLRVYPIVALLWSAVGLGAVILIGYDPGRDLVQIVVVPWLCVQLAAVPATAGVYGILDGWLALPLAGCWWPLVPARRALTQADASDILRGYDSTGPGLLPARALNAVGERSIR